MDSPEENLILLEGGQLLLHQLEVLVFGSPDKMLLENPSSAQNHRESRVKLRSRSFLVFAQQHSVNITQYLLYAKMYRLLLNNFLASCYLTSTVHRVRISTS